MNKPPKVFNVKDYGAVGDGVHDDGPAIQACLDAMAAWDGPSAMTTMRSHRIVEGLVVHRAWHAESDTEEQG